MRLLKQDSAAELAIQAAEQILQDANITLLDVTHITVRGIPYELIDASTGQQSGNFPRLTEEERFARVEDS